MTRSAKGTMDAPGTNVRQKAGLSRAVLEQGWFGFETLMGPLGNPRPSGRGKY
jgi:putative transposase